MNKTSRIKWAGGRQDQVPRLEGTAWSVAKEPEASGYWLWIGSFLVYLIKVCGVAYSYICLKGELCHGFPLVSAEHNSCFRPTCTTSLSTHVLSVVLLQSESPWSQLWENFGFGKLRTSKIKKSSNRWETLNEKRTDSNRSQTHKKEEKGASVKETSARVFRN